MLSPVTVVETYTFDKINSVHNFLSNPAKKHKNWTNPITSLVEVISSQSIQ